MLVLTRKKGETIMIGNDISLTVLNVDGDTVKLGIIAPSEVPVFRRELYEAIQIANQQSIVNTDMSSELKQLLSKSGQGPNIKNVRQSKRNKQ